MLVTEIFYKRRLSKHNNTNVNVPQSVGNINFIGRCLINVNIILRMLNFIRLRSNSNCRRTIADCLYDLTEETGMWA